MWEKGSLALANVSYASYLIISIAMTIWVARVLSKNGEMFLVKCFGHDRELARSTNHLLVIGFYLVNIGFICARLDGWSMYNADLVPNVGSKVGISVLALGFMHFFNMAMIAKFGRTVNGWVRANTRDSNVSAALPAKAAE